MNGKSSYTQLVKQVTLMDFNLEGINIVVNNDSIMSISEETVIKVSKDEYIKKTIKSIKELIRK